MCSISDCNRASVVAEGQVPAVIRLNEDMYVAESRLPIVQVDLFDQKVVVSHLPERRSCQVADDPWLAILIGKENALGQITVVKVHEVKCALGKVAKL